MRLSIGTAIAVLLLSSTGASLAASGISTEEEHVLRGYFDRQSTVVAADKLALQKGSTEAIRKFAQSELDMYQQLGTDLAALFKQFGLVTVPNPTGEYRPLEEGKSRGVTELKDGATFSTVGILQTLARSGAQGQAAAPAMPRPANCQSPTVPGCGPTIAPGVDLTQLSGADFDNTYLLLVFYGHDAMMRHSTDELLFAQSSPAMVAFAKHAIELIGKQSRTADGLYRGTANAQSGTQRAPVNGAAKAPKE